MHSLVSKSGLFDIAYDDGTYESKVARCRLRLDDPVTTIEAIPAVACDMAKRRMRTRIVRQARRSEAAAKRLGRAVSPTTDILVLGSPEVDESAASASASATTCSDSVATRASDEHDDLDDVEAEEKRRSQVTMLPSNDWTLIYEGNGNSYECGGLVPPHVVEFERSVSVPVQFALQTSGTEFPAHERSQIAVCETAWTRRPWWANVNANEDDDDDNGDDDRSTAVTAENSVSTAMKSPHSSASSSTSTGTTVVQARAPGGKEIIVTQLRGHGAINIEKRHNTCYGVGLAPHYI